jgi:myo-inositol-1(or 4)-monophosphatase
MADVQQLAALAVRAAAAAAALHRRGLGRVRDIATKSSATDMVTEIDRAAERVVVEAIRRERPADAILGEEETRLEGTSGVRWIIDPLDGTTNYIYGYPAYAVSIGIEIEGERTVGVVHDSAREEVFAGIRGRGATLNRKPLHVRAQADLATALVATGFLASPAERARLGAIVAKILPRVRDIRRGGSAAIDLCSVAAGRVDAYYEVGLGEWDLAGGIVIAEAAGAAVRLIDLRPGPTPLAVVCAPALLEPLLELLHEAGAF